MGSEDATAPKQENCRGRASRVCAVPDATLKQASCGVCPVARPLAAPADWETASGGLGNLWKFSACSTLTTNHYFPSFPMLRSSLPNPPGEAEGLARAWGGGRNVVSGRRDRTSQDAHRASPRRFPTFGAVAPYPAWELAKWRYRAETGNQGGWSLSQGSTCIFGYVPKLASNPKR